MKQIEKLRERASKLSKHIVLTEGPDERMVAAASIAVSEKVASRVTLLGNVDQIRSKSSEIGVDISRVELLDPEKGNRREEFTEIYYQLRSKKGISRDDAWKVSGDPLYYGDMMVRVGEADGSVSGATHSTADVIRAAIHCIGTRKSVSVVSGCFLMVVPDYLDTGEEKSFIYADSGVMPNPNPQQLAEIAVTSAQTYIDLVGGEPYVAMLSFSTKGSAKHPDVDKVVEATNLAKKMSPELKIDGELQLDAAIIPKIASTKCPGSEVGGRANVIIFPDLDAGNIGYKLTERLAKAEAMGPLLQGLSAPAHDLSRGCDAEDIVNVAAIAALMSVSRDEPPKIG